MLTAFVDFIVTEYRLLPASWSPNIVGFVATIGDISICIVSTLLCVSAHPIAFSTPAEVITTVDPLLPVILVDAEVHAEDPEQPGSAVEPAVSPNV